jgi:hypothetical protein
LELKLLIVNEKELFFVHVPKCAGTYVKSLLVGLDSYPGQFDRVKKHEVIGLVDYTHLPLTVLHNYFPSEFLKLTKYNSFSIIRNPYERFQSSVAQYLKMYCGGPIHSFPVDELHNHVKKIIEEIYRSNDKEVLPYKLIHFQPQHSYLYLNGELIVSNIFCQEDVGQVHQYLSRVIGPEILAADTDYKLDSYARNSSKIYSSKIVRILLDNGIFSLRKIFYKIIPYPIKNRLKNILMKDVPAGYLNDKDISVFVNDFYKRDIEMYSKFKRQG